jgi:hypothetical protein
MISVPEMVKVFLGKVSNNLLPTKENLYKRKMVHDPLCPICRLKVEIVSHILWRCQSSMDIRKECSKKNSKMLWRRR